MHTKSDNIANLIGNETDEIIDKLFDPFLQKYQKGLKESMKGSEFVFDSLDLFYQKLHKISLNHGSLYTDSPKWLKTKKSNNKSKKKKKKKKKEIIMLNAFNML